MTTDTKGDQYYIKCVLNSMLIKAKGQDINAGALSRAWLKFHTWREPQEFCTIKLLSETST